jgi:diguanylate cyclase (GGDEF)-like protein
VNNKNKILFSENVRDYMISPIPYVEEGSTLKEAANFMSSNKTSVVLVRDKEFNYIGIITESDFTRKVVAKECSVNTAIVDSVMSTPVKTIKGSTTMAEANKKMLRSGIRHLAVVEKEEFVGLLSAINFFSYFENVEKYLGDLAVNDGLTGIHNRRHFDEIINIEWKRAKREKSPLSLIMLDIDYFKKYNDTYGHQAGDECLIKVATALSDSMRRPADLVARYGGEEFVIVLPNVELNEATKFSEKIRADIEDLKIEHRLSSISPFITASLGVASILPSNDSTHEALLQSADKALYNAKIRGRNCVTIAHG